MLSNIYSYFFQNKKLIEENENVDVETQCDDDNDLIIRENENKELDEEIKKNISNKIVIRNYDKRIIKDIKIKENNDCFKSYPCLHDVILIFDDNTYEDTTMNIIVLYEIWKNLYFDINIKFLKHCKNEYKMNNTNNTENLVENLFLNKYTIV